MIASQMALTRSRVVSIGSSRARHKLCTMVHREYHTTTPRFIAWAFVYLLRDSGLLPWRSVDRAPLYCNVDFFGCHQHNGFDGGDTAGIDGEG